MVLILSWGNYRETKPLYHHQINQSIGLNYKTQYYWSMNQATPGITAPHSWRVLINKNTYDLDVGPGYPSGVEATNGSFVQR